MKCFEYNNNHKNNCQKESCRYWIRSKKYQNCCLISADESRLDEAKFTLQDIGDIFKVTRMRICQIEKIAVKKLKDKLSNFK